MRKVLLGLALLAPFNVESQTTPVRGQSGFDTGAIVNCVALDGSAARCLMPGVIPYDTTGAPLGTAANPLNVTGGAGGGGGGNPVDATGNGSLALATSNATYVIPLTGGRNAVGLTISGLTGSGATITVERSNNGGSIWTNANTTESSATGSLSATITADGQARVGVAGATQIRLRVSTAGTGTATIAYNATTAAGPVFLTGYLPSYSTPDGRIIGGVDNRFVNGTTISTGSGATDAGTQRVSLATDGTYATAGNQTTGNNSLATLAATVGNAGTPAATAQTVQGTVSAVGNVAAGATDAGNPVKIGGYGTDTSPTAVTNGQRTNAWFQRNGALSVAIVTGSGGNQTNVIDTNSDNIPGFAGLTVQNWTRLYNATGGFDRQRGTVNGTAMIVGLDPSSIGGATSTTVLGTASNLFKTTTGNIASLNVVNSTAAGFLVVLDVAAAPAAGAAITAAQLKYCMPLAASAAIDKQWPIPLNNANGINVAVLTSCTVYTTVGTAPISMTAQFK